MDRTSITILAVSGLLVVGIFATAQTQQGWKLKRADSSDMVQFTVERHKNGDDWSSSNVVPFARFRGLSIDTIEHGGPANFEYVQDAGRLVCRGDFSWGRGSGSFTFVPNPQFPDEMRRLGYDAPSDEQVFSMMMMGIGLDYARGIKDAGLHASTKELIDLSIHGVSLKYVHETKEAGYGRLNAQDFIDMRIHGVRTEFLADLKRTGYDLSSKEVVELAIHGVNSEYLRELKAYGLQPQSSDLVNLRIHGVSPEYLRGLKDAGYTHLFAQEMVDLRIHGVSIDFIQQSKSLGYDFTAKELTDLSIHGVNGAYLRRLRDSGLRNLNAAQIEKLKIHGVD